jgi:hypothetical protein
MKRFAILLCGLIVYQAASGQSYGACGTKYYCKEMTSCAEAQHFYKNCGLNRLDRDRDGIPCENLCGDPKRHKKARKTHAY